MAVVLRWIMVLIVEGGITGRSVHHTGRLSVHHVAHRRFWTICPARTCGQWRKHYTLLRLELCSIIGKGPLDMLVHPRRFSSRTYTHAIEIFAFSYQEKAFSKRSNGFSFTRSFETDYSQETEMEATTIHFAGEFSVSSVIGRRMKEQCLRGLYSIDSNLKSQTSQVKLG